MVRWSRYLVKRSFQGKCVEVCVHTHYYKTVDSITIPLLFHYNRINYFSLNLSCLAKLKLE